MIRVGGRYTFKGFKAIDGIAEVTSEQLASRLFDTGAAVRIFWVTIARTGHPLNGKTVPYSVASKHIGCWRSQLPDLDQEIA